MSTFDEIIQVIYAKVWELSAPLPLAWHQENTGSPVGPELVLEQDVTYAFSAIVTWPEEKCGIALTGETGTLYNYIWLPCALSLDGVEIFQEDHLWHATGPWWYEFSRAITPGMQQQLRLHLQPTGRAGNDYLRPDKIFVNCRKCIETAVEISGIAMELELAGILEPSLRDEAAACLDRKALEADDWPKFLASARRMEAFLLPLHSRIRELQITLIAYSHIDMDWMWRWEDTAHCIRRDFKATVDLMAENSTLTFSMSQIPCYDLIQQEYPGLFREVQRLMAEGRWENLASTWVENDFYLVNGDIIAKQIAMAHAYCQENLPTSASVMFAPDTFGHPANMPQIARLGRMPYYFGERCNPGGEDPYPLRRWVGADGSEVLTASSAYKCDLTLPEMLEVVAWRSVKKNLRQGIAHTHVIWGMGDHGGALVKANIDLLEILKKLPLLPQFHFGTLAGYLREMEKNPQIPTFHGESSLIFEGCYTTHMQVKLLNSKAAHRLLDTDMLAFLRQNDNTGLAQSWQDVLFNQFHDILCGAAIAAASRDAEARSRRAIAATEDFIGKGRTLINFWPDPVKELVEIDGRMRLLELPAGYIGGMPAPEAEKSPEVTEFPAYFEINTGIRCIRINKSDGTLLTPGVRGNILQLWTEEPHDQSAWSLGNIVNKTNLLPTAVTLAECGAGAVRLRLHYSFGQSTVNEELWFHDNFEAIELKIKVDWHEPGNPECGVPLLKLGFDDRVKSGSVSSWADSPFHLDSRPADGREQPMQSLAARVRDDGSGMVLFSQSCQGFSADADGVRLSLVRTAYAPDPVSDSGILEFHFRYAESEQMHPSDLWRRARNFQHPPQLVAGTIVNKVPLLYEELGDIVVTCYEPTTEAVAVHLFNPGSEAVTLQLKSPVRESDFTGQTALNPIRELHFPPFGIKVVVVDDKQGIR